MIESASWLCHLFPNPSWSMDKQLDMKIVTVCPICKNIHATCCMQNPRMLTSNSNATCLAHVSSIYIYVYGYIYIWLPNNLNIFCKMASLQQTWVSENRIYMDIHPSHVNLNGEKYDEPDDVFSCFPHFLAQVPNLRSSYIRTSYTVYIYI